MNCSSLDLTIDGALSDAVIGAAMRADHVDPRQLEHLLRATARDLDVTRRRHGLDLALLAQRARRAVAGSKPLW